MSSAAPVPRQGRRDQASLILLPAALLFGACSLEPAPQDAPSCPPDPTAPTAPAILVTGEFPGPAIRRVPVATMERLDPGFVAAPGRTTRGLTNAEWSLHSSVDTVERDKGAWACLAIATVTVAISYKALEVLIDETLPEDSCLYREILAHEQEHVRVRADAHKRLQDLVVETLSASPRLPASARPALFKSVAEGRREALAAVKALVEEASQTAKGEADAHNARLDSPESYADLAVRCRKPGY